MNLQINQLLHVSLTIWYCKYLYIFIRIDFKINKMFKSALKPQPFQFTNISSHFRCDTTWFMKFYWELLAVMFVNIKWMLSLHQGNNCLRLLKYINKIMIFLSCDRLLGALKAFNSTIRYFNLLFLSEFFL